MMKVTTNLKRLGAAMCLFPEEAREYARKQCIYDAIDEKVKRALKEGHCDSSLIEERRCAKSAVLKAMMAVDEKLQEELGMSFLTCAGDEIKK